MRERREEEEVGSAMVRQRGEGGMRTTATHVTGETVPNIIYRPMSTLIKLLLIGVQVGIPLPRLLIDCICAGVQWL